MTEAKLMKYFESDAIRYSKISMFEKNFLPDFSIQEVRWLDHQSPCVIKDMNRHRFEVSNFKVVKFVHFVPLLTTPRHNTRNFIKVKKCIPILLCIFVFGFKQLMV